MGIGKNSYTMMNICMFVIDMFKQYIGHIWCPLNSMHHIITQKKYFLRITFLLKCTKFFLKKDFWSLPSLFKIFIVTKKSNKSILKSILSNKYNFDGIRGENIVT